MKQAGGPALQPDFRTAFFRRSPRRKAAAILPNTNRQCHTPSPQIQAENGRVLFDAAIRLQGEMILKKHNRFAGRALSLLCALCFLALLPAGCTPAEETPDGPVLTVDGRSFAVESRNALSGVSCSTAATARRTAVRARSAYCRRTAPWRIFPLSSRTAQPNSHRNVLPAPRESAYTSPQTAASFTCRRSLHGRADAGGLRAGHGGLHRPDGGRLRDRRKRAHGALR